jgi:hypothetical protein
MRLSVLPVDLRIGDTILEGKKGTLVTKLGVCQSSHRGVPKIHVNEKDCYGNVQEIPVSRPTPKAPKE